MLTFRRRQLAKVIDINAAASIEYLANKAEITAGFLNKKDVSHVVCEQCTIWFIALTSICLDF